MNADKPTVSRRNFLQRTTAAAAATMAVPLILPSRLFGAAAPSKRVALGHIGVGGQGGGLLGGFLGLPQAQSVATCDPFKDRAEGAARRVEQQYAAATAQGTYKGCKAYQDFRELLARDDIDAVVIATPDHWHVPIALAAVRAGKDVYVEKPLGISVEHNKALRAAVHQFGAVFQYGTQQRSFNTHCAHACELVRNGYLGELKAVHVVAPNGSRGGNAAPQPIPAGLDYDLWLGPAPVTPYATDRVVGTGRWFIYDYAIGFIAGWGAHPLDIAHWGYPHIPVEYEGTGVVPTEGLFDTVVDWDVRGRYASGAEFTLKPGGDLTTFVGTTGWVAASRGGITAEPASLLQVKLKPDELHLLQDNHHYRNFLNGVLTRKTPASDIDSAVQSDFISHLGDICIRTGRKLKWDPVQETIVGDEAAARLLRRPMREPWTL
ncbi:MAG: Gfo/Idh/MocA family oxidoreductase [Planctomycetota bacterium]|nr:Gfo/Idh/MocA family oxidoreductase [Planctomycetota bacterium]